MSPRRHLARFAVAVLSFGVVSVGLVAASAAVALSIDWDIPEGDDDLLGPSSLFDRNGRPLYRFAAEVERRPVSLDRIAPSLQDAVVATEDHRFFEHQGVDPFAVVRAVWSNVRHGGIREGGSTLTQQYVKNVYVGADRTFWRKVREAVISLQLEKERGKEDILESYLNRVYFGDGAYGAQAAALTYFGKPAAELELHESATLAGVLTSPSRLTPRTNPDGATTSRDRVLDRMALLGFVSREEADAAQARPLDVVPRDRALPAAPYYVEEVRKLLLADPNIGPERLYNGGLVITAALDYDAQLELERSVLPHLPEDASLDFGIAVVDPATGDLRAAWSGRNFEASQVDLALRRASGRPSGSTFKVFGLAAALESGMDLTTTYPSPQQVRISSVWQPRGGGGCGSPCTLREAIVRSSNTVFAQVGRDVGVESFTEMAYRLGLRSTLSQDPGEIAQVLGTADVTPLDMASAFGTLANDGVACPARLVTDIRDPHGAPVDVPDPRQPSEEQLQRWAAHLDGLGYDFGDEDLGRCHRAVAPSLARTMNTALVDVVERGTGRGARLDGWQVAGKTGTTDENRMAWFSGYTTELSMAVAFGGRETQVPLRNIPGCGAVCFGGDLPATVWRDAAERLHADLEPAEFPEPGEDERVMPDRRRLGPSTDERTPAATPTPTPTPTPTASPDPTPTAEPTAEPDPEPTETPPDDDNGGGLLPPLPGQD